MIASIANAEGLTANATPIDVAAASGVISPVATCLRFTLKTRTQTHLRNNFKNGVTPIIAVCHATVFTVYLRYCRYCGTLGTYGIRIIRIP